jgi:hypothetical protein
MTQYLFFKQFATDDGITESYSAELKSLVFLINFDRIINN